MNAREVWNRSVRQASLMTKGDQALWELTAVQSTASRRWVEMRAAVLAAAKSGWDTQQDTSLRTGLNVPLEQVSPHYANDPEKIVPWLDVLEQLHPTAVARWETFLVVLLSPAQKEFPCDGKGPSL